jgi:hypothetical protein
MARAAPFVSVGGFLPIVARIPWLHHLSGGAHARCRHDQPGVDL